MEHSALNVLTIVADTEQSIFFGGAKLVITGSVNAQVGTQRPCSCTLPSYVGYSGNRHYKVCSGPSR